VCWQLLLCLVWQLLWSVWQLLCSVCGRRCIIDSCWCERSACEGGRSGHLTWHYFFFFLSFHVLPNLRAAKGPERSGGTQPSDLFSFVGYGRRSACAMGKWAPPSAHAYCAQCVVGDLILKAVVFSDLISSTRRTLYLFFRVNFSSYSCAGLSFHFLSAGCFMKKTWKLHVLLKDILPVAWLRVIFYCAQTLSVFWEFVGS